jgi:hypothetical protein
LYNFLLSPSSLYNFLLSPSSLYNFLLSPVTSFADKTSFSAPYFQTISSFTSVHFIISHIFSPYSFFVCNVQQCVVTVVTLYIQFTSLLLIFIEAVVTASPSALEALHMYTPSSSPRTCVMSKATKPKSWVLVIREPTKPNTEGLFDVYAHLIS